MINEAPKDMSLSQGHITRVQTPKQSNSTACALSKLLFSYLILILVVYFNLHTLYACEQLQILSGIWEDINTNNWVYPHWISIPKALIKVQS